MRNVVAVVVMLVCSAGAASATELGVEGSRFTLDGRPTFLLGCSYYAGCGASDETVRKDLDELKHRGFNWVRVWATWASFDRDVSAVDGPTGGARQPYLDRLKKLVEECDRRGMVVDVTLSRGNGATGPARLQGLDAHRKAVETLISALSAKKNWYLDLSNERNIRDKRYTPVEDLADLREAARRANPRLLVTASHAGDVTREDVAAYLTTAKLDFLSIHRPRDTKSPGQTAETTRQVLKWAGEILGEGKSVPLHYDEPFRRGWSDWNPKAEDYLSDLKAARESGAAGWCFHNGATRGTPDGNPRRSFDLSARSLFEQLDDEEKKFLKSLATARQ